MCLRIVPSAGKRLLHYEDAHLAALNRTAIRTMGPLKADPVYGLDGRWSWITAALCSWVLFLAMSGLCSSGVLYYGIIDTFGTTREEASWPVTLPDSLLNLAGRINL